MNAKIFIKTKTKQINLRRNRIGASNRIDSTLFTNNRDRKWRMSVLVFFLCFSTDTLEKVSLVSILKYPSENPHNDLYIPKLVMYFDSWMSNFLDFINIFPIFWLFPFQIYFIFYFFGIFGQYSCDNTKYRYLIKVSILNNTKRYRYNINSIDTVSHH